MNKEQQIEEIAGTICNACKERFEDSKKCKIKPCLAAYVCAERLYNADYRKIDEFCAVITKIELKEYKRQAGKEVLESLKYASNRVYPEYIPDMIDEYLEDYK